MTQRFLRLFAFVLVSALLTAGCSGGSPSTAPAGGQEQPAAGGTAPAAEPVRISFVQMTYDSEMENWGKELVAEFEAANQDIKVDYQVVSDIQLHDWLLTRGEGGQAPDIVNVAAAWIPDYAGRDWLATVDEVLPAGFKDAFFASVWEQGSYDGKQYGIPDAVSTRALYYRSDLFEAKGIKPPTTWAELMATAKAVADPPAVYGLALQGKEEETFAAQFINFAWANGGGVYDSNGRIKVDTPENTATLEFLVSMIQAKSTQPQPTGTGTQDTLDLFKSGTVAMTMSGPWLIPYLADSPEIKFGVLPIPYQSQKAALGVADCLVLFKSAIPKKEAVARFLQFMYEPARRLQFDRDHGMLPELQAVAADAFFQQNPSLKVFVDQIEYATFVPLRDDWTKLATEGTKAVQATYAGEKSPEQALKDLQALMER